MTFVRAVVGKIRALHNARCRRSNRAEKEGGMRERPWIFPKEAKLLLGTIEFLKACAPTASAWAETLGSGLISVALPD